MASLYGSVVHVNPPREKKAASSASVVVTGQDNDNGLVVGDSIANDGEAASSSAASPAAASPLARLRMKSLRSLARNTRLSRQLLVKKRRPSLELNGNEWDSNRQKNPRNRLEDLRGHARSMALIKPEIVLSSLEELRQQLLSRGDVRKNKGGPGRVSLSGAGDSLTIDALVELKNAFEEADTDGSGALDEEEFVEAFLSVPALAKWVNSEALQHLFMKIDANSDGTVDWDEFTNHLMLEQERKLEFDAGDDSKVSYEKVVPRSAPTQLPSIHSAASSVASSTDGNDVDLSKLEAITCICHLPGNNCYVTGGRDGHVRTWSYKLKPLKVAKKLSAWITSMAHMGTQPLAVACMDRSITFFDAHRPSLDILARIFSLTSIPVSLHWAAHKECDMLLYGDDRGRVHVYALNDAWGEVETKELDEKTGMEEGMKKLTGMTLKKMFKDVHSNWVTRVLFIEHNDTLISSSLDGTINVSDFSKRTVKWSTRAHSGGVNSFLHCRAFNFIASCGTEREVMLWNPFTGRRSGILTGHTASVLDICLNERETLLFSLCADKSIKVWDIRMNRCIQTIVDKENLIPENRYFAMIYNKLHKKIVVASNKLVTYKRQARGAKVQRAVSTALYNSNFRQLVAGTVDSMVKVWAVDNGDAVFSFENVHGSTTITAIAFDETGRRLITGSMEGQVRTWNFNNGQQLGEFEGFGEEEVTCLAYMVEGPNRFILAGGWNHRVCLWSDNVTFLQTAPIRSFTKHAEDVTCMAVCTNTASTVVASGGYDGVVFVWGLDCSVKHKMRAASLSTTDSDSRQALEMRSLSGGTKSKQGRTSGANSALAVLHIDNRLRVWRTTDGSLLLEVDVFGSLRSSAEPTSLDVDVNSLMLYIGDNHGAVTQISLAGVKFNAASRSDRVSQNGTLHKPLLSLDASRTSSPWQAQDASLVAVCFVAKFNVLICVSKNGEARLYRPEGAYIGTFNAGAGWDLSEIPDASQLTSAIEAFNVRTLDDENRMRIASPELNKKGQKRSEQVPRTKEQVENSVELVLIQRAQRRQGRISLPKLMPKLPTHKINKVDPSKYLQNAR
ncbi:EF-hand domain-containing protein [Pseudoscourfieldia marina]